MAETINNNSGRRLFGLETDPILVPDPSLWRMSDHGSQPRSLVAKSSADLPEGPYWIAGATPAAPSDGVNVLEDSDYQDASAHEPGHAWPYMSPGSLMISTGLSPDGYWPACSSNQGINHYRRGFFMRHGWLTEGALARVQCSGDVISPRVGTNVFEVVLQPKLVTATPTTTFDPLLRFGFRWDLATLSTARAFLLEIYGCAISDFKSIWWASLVIAGSNVRDTAGQTSPFVSAQRVLEMDFDGSGYNPALESANWAFLFKIESSATAFGTIGSSAILQDGTDGMVRMGSYRVDLFPGK